MKSYSQADLLKRAPLKNLSFVEKSMYFLFGINSNPKIQLELPERVFDRLEIFSRDMADLTGAVRFRVYELFQMLLTDLTFFIKTNQNPKLFKKRLSSIIGKEIVVNTNGRIEQFYVPRFEYEDDDYILIDCKFKRKDILRLEAELADLDLIEPNHGIEVEDILEAMIMSFYERLVAGENKEAVEAIRNFLDSGKDVW